MIQFKKQIARLKINQFLKENKVVLFFHSDKNTSRNLDEIKKKLVQFYIGTNHMLIKNKIAQTLTNSNAYSKNKANLRKKQSRPHICNAFAYKCIANTSHVVPKFADANISTKTSIRMAYPLKKNIQAKSKDGYNFFALLKGTAGSSKSQKKLSYKSLQHDTVFAGKTNVLNNNDLYKYENLSIASVNVDTLLKSKESSLQKELNLSPFHGPCIFLGVTQISHIKEILDIYNQQKELILLGGFYSNWVITHKQIEKLSVWSLKSNTALSSLLCNNIKSPVSKTVGILQNRMCLAFLKSTQNRLIQIFNSRCHQLRRKQV